MWKERVRVYWVSDLTKTRSRLSVFSVGEADLDSSDREWILIISAHAYT